MVRPDRTVALKALRPSVAAATGAQRFLREVGTAARLQHPNIVTVYESGEADGVPFYVMPYVEGESLRGRLCRDGPLPIREIVQIVSDVAAALEYAHARQIVHRDVKPENILLTGGRALVTDFGIARAMKTGVTGLTDTGLVIGTPHYMAPEQIAGGEELDGRADVYALGSVAYEMLTGSPPFPGPTARDVLLRRLADPAPRVRRLRADATYGMERALRKALARLPADRFAVGARVCGGPGRAASFGPAGAATSGRPPVSQPERRSRQRVRRRRHYRGRHRPAGESGRAQGDFANVGNGVQGARATCGRSVRASACPQSSRAACDGRGHGSGSSRSSSTSARTSTSGWRPTIES